ncbi:MAG: fructose-1,6-bisphosphatase [Candidatus Moduliflexus flocculans]|nr:fructose-1,6-bisphosphatase [Candidatus Moduliflexus flocculans]
MSRHLFPGPPRCDARPRRRHPVPVDGGRAGRGRRRSPRRLRHGSSSSCPIRRSGSSTAISTGRAARSHLVQLGDIMDRGPDARKIFDLLMRPRAGSRGRGRAWSTRSSATTRR